MTKNWFEKLNARRAGGLKAKNNGRIFENIFEEGCRSVGLACTRFPDGCKRLGLKKLMQIPTPWDYIVTNDGVSAMLDTKSVAEAAFSHSNIKEHQVKEMLSHTLRGAVGGYVIWLRKPARVIFVPARVLWARMGERGSIKENDPGVISLGDLAESPLAGAINLGLIFKAKAHPTGPAPVDARGKK